MRAVCLALPETYEEQAWTGVRWCVRRKNIAHVVAIENGWPPAYAAAANTDGPAIVLTFRAPEDEVEALSRVGDPFFKPVWFPDIVGMFLTDRTDWGEVEELVIDSYRVLAPRNLAAQLDAATRAPDQ